MWRPDGWISEISFEEITKIEPHLVSMMTIKEKKIFEAGADAMLEALRKSGLRVSNINPEGADKGIVIFIPDEKG